MKLLFFSVLILLPTFAICEEIHLGVISSLTGYGSASGLSTLEGAQLAVDEINSTGGINKKKIILHSEDNQSDPKNGVTALYKLKSSNKIIALIGPNWSEFAEPVASIANVEKVPMISPTGHTPTLLRDHPYVFSLLIPARDAIRPLTSYLLRQNFNEIHILYSQNAFYEMLTTAISENLKGNIPYSKELVSSSNLDFKSTITKLKIKKNTAIIAFLQENGPVSTFVKQARSMGIPAERIFLGPVIKDDQILQKDTALTNDIRYFEYVFTIKETFQKKFRRAFNKEPRYDSTLSYDAVYMLKNSIEKCGLNPEQIIACIPTSLNEGESGPIMFDKNKDRIMSVPVTEVLKMHNGMAVKVQ